MRIFIAVLVLFLTIGISTAQEDERQKLALQIVELTTSGAMVDQMVNAIWPTVEASLIQENQGVSEENLAAMKDEFANMQRGLIAVVIVDVVAFYAENYTQEELAALLVFYQSPLGEKTLAMSPRLMGEIMPSMMQKMQQELPAMMQKFKELAQDKGLVVS